MVLPSGIEPDCPPYESGEIAKTSLEAWHGGDSHPKRRTIGRMRYLCHMHGNIGGVGVTRTHIDAELQSAA